MKKVLVTGECGFIGNHLCPYLRSEGLEVIEFGTDVRRPELFPEGKFDLIIHLASLISHRGDHSEKDMREVNVVGTNNLLSRYPKAKMVYVSTKDVTREELSYYAQTKLEAEKSVLNANKNNLVIRLPSVFGPGQRQQDKLIPRLFRSCLYNEPCQITSDDEREYIFVDEVCKKIYDNLSATGMIALDGTRIRNEQLKKLIESVCMGKSSPKLHAPEENELLKQLMATMLSYGSKP